MKTQNEERGTRNEWPAARAGVPFRVPRSAFRVLLALLVIALVVAPAASACPVCWGNPNDPMVKSANNGIWVLLGIVGFVQIGFAALFITFWRRAREQKRFRESLHVIHQFDEGRPLS